MADSPQFSDKYLIFSYIIMQIFICSTQGGIVHQRVTVYLAAMYYKVSMRTNPATGRYCGYYRLVESYRNQSDRVCHRTMLNAGYLDELTTDQLNLIQKILTAKVANHDNALFKLPYTDDKIVMHYVDEFYNRMVSEKRIDVLVEQKDKIILYDLHLF